MRKNLGVNEDLLSLLLLSAMVQIAVVSVLIAGWVDGLDVLPWIAFIAIAWGFAFARLPIPGLFLHVAAMIVGSGVIAYLVSFTLLEGSLEERFAELYDRVANWVNVTFTGGISNDNLLFLLLLAGITWLIGYFGAWSVFRTRSGWLVSLAAGTALVINISYAPNLAGFFVLFVFCAVLLVARLNLYRRERFWQEAGIEYRRDLGRIALQVSFLITAVAVAAAWFTPSALLASQPVSDVTMQLSRPWDDIQGEFNRLFGGVRPKGEMVPSSFGKTLPLKTGVKLGGEVVLQVVGDEPRRLRGVVYEKYTGHGWLAAERQGYRIPANSEHRPLSPAYKLRKDVTQTITIVQPRGNIIFVPSLPKLLDIPVMADLELPSDALVTTNGLEGDVDMDFADVSALRSQAVVRRGFRYTVVSSVSVADADSLRGVGDSYPSWVRERYLPLPRTITRRTMLLARQLAFGHDNSYDVTVAIESYLRTLNYSDEVTLPPSVRDAVDYFLFEGKEGYCDYFASAFAVLARLRGIPTRVVSGFAPGDLDLAQGIITVRDWHAHSWPEVYFPGYGWIEFEPTPSRPAIVRPEAPPVETTGSTGQDDIGGGSEDRVDLLAIEAGEVAASTEGIASASFADGVLDTLIRFAIGAIAFVALAYAIVIVAWRYGIAGLRGGVAAYAKMSRLGRWLGLGRRPDQTPDEYRASLAKLVPQERQSMRLITDAYMQEIFGRKKLSPAEERLVDRAWRRLRMAMLRARLGRWRVGDA